MTSLAFCSAGGFGPLPGDRRKNHDALLPFLGLPPRATAKPTASNVTSLGTLRTSHILPPYRSIFPFMFASLVSASFPAGDHRMQQSVGLGNYTGGLCIQEKPLPTSTEGMRITQLQKETSMKIALVTGGSRGLGKSMSLHIAAKGNDGVLTYRSKKAEAERLKSKSNKPDGKPRRLRSTFPTASPLTVLPKNSEKYCKQSGNAMTSTF